MSSPGLRWGVLGAARIAETAVIPALLEAGGTLAALASRDRLRGEELGRSFGARRVFADYRQVLESDSQAVYIPLPNALHFGWVREALLAGKHVLCEKPLCCTAAEAEELDLLARRRGLVLAEAVMYRYHPRWQQLLELVSSGRIGRLRHLTGCFCFNLREERDIRWRAELGGGALYDVGSYLVNSFRQLASEPSRVVATGAQRDGVDRSTTFLLEFGSSAPEGVTAAGTCSFEADELQELQLIGTVGSCTVIQPFTCWREQRPPLQLWRGGQGPELVETKAADPYQEMVAAFHDAVATGAEPLSTAQDAARTLRVIEGCQRSVAEGGWVELS